MPEKKIVLSWLGTAGFHLRYTGQELLFDPYLSRLPGTSPEIRAKPADFNNVSMILVSHGHFDHAMDVAELVSISGARVYAPQKTCDLLRSQGVDPGLLSPNERLPSFSWAGATIRVVPSRHITFDAPLILKTLGKALRGGVLLKVLRLGKAWPLGSNSEFLMDFSGYRLLFSGSGGGDWSALAKLKPHCCMLPFAGRSDLTDIYMRALHLIRPDTVVLHHFDKFFPSFCVDYPVEEFRDRLERELPQVRLIIPDAETEFTLP